MGITLCSAGERLSKTFPISIAESKYSASLIFLTEQQPKNRFVVTSLDVLTCIPVMG